MQVQERVIGEKKFVPAKTNLFENRDDGGFLLSSIGVIANVDFNDFDKKLGDKNDELGGVSRFDVSALNESAFGSLGLRMWTALVSSVGE